MKEQGIGTALGFWGDSPFFLWYSKKNRQEKLRPYWRDRKLETGIKSTDMYRYIELLETGKKFMKMMNKYRCAIMEVETKLKVLNAEFSLQYDRNPFESIESRLKSPESIMEKLVRRG